MNGRSRLKEAKKLKLENFKNSQFCNFGKRKYVRASNQVGVCAKIVPTSLNEHHTASSRHVLPIIIQ